MKITEKHKWLYFYTLPCTKECFESIEKLPNIQKIKSFLNGDYSKKKIRDYFFIKHNKETIEFMEKIDDYQIQEEVHLLIPYKVNDVLPNLLSCTICKPFYELPKMPNHSIFKNALEKAIELKVIEEIPDIGDILLMHGDYFVDVVKEKDLKKYNYLYKKKKK